MEHAFFRSPSRRELKEQRMQRKEVSRAVNTALTTLDAVVHAIQRGDSATEAVGDGAQVPISDIPSTLLPKRSRPKVAAAQSLVKAMMQNENYEADLKSRPNHGAETLPAANGGSKRPIVTQDRPLPVSWEAKGGKNDLSNVQSKLSYVRGGAAPPPIYNPNAEGVVNPRKEIEAKRQQYREKIIAPQENKVAPFEYKPKVVKLESSALPRVATLDVPVTAARPRSAPTVQGKPFR